MEFKKVNSSMLEGYNYQDGNFYAKFKNGNVYKYEGVSQQIVENLDAAESKGRYFINNIKLYHNGVKIDE